MNKTELIHHLRSSHPDVRSVRDVAISTIARKTSRSVLNDWHVEDHQRHGEHSDVLLRRRFEAQKYPEHEKLRAVQDKSQAVGEFLEWLRIPEDEGGKGVHLHTWAEWEENDLCSYYTPKLGSCSDGKIGFYGKSERDCPKCDGTGLVKRPREGWISLGIGVQKLLAEFFDIDLVKLEQEKRAMLEALTSG